MLRGVTQTLTLDVVTLRDMLYGIGVSDYYYAWKMLKDELPGRDGSSTSIKEFHKVSYSGLI